LREVDGFGDGYLRSQSTSLVVLVKAQERGSAIDEIELELGAKFYFLVAINTKNSANY